MLQIEPRQTLALKEWNKIIPKLIQKRDVKICLRVLNTSVFHKVMVAGENNIIFQSYLYIEIVYIAVLVASKSRGPVGFESFIL